MVDSNKRQDDKKFGLLLVRIPLLVVLALLTMLAIGIAIYASR